MRNYLYLSLLLALFVFGCKEELNFISPAEQTNTEEPNWISLPDAQDPSLEKCFTVGQVVYGNRETSLELDRGYAGGPHGWISISAVAKFQRKCFTGKRFVTMTVNDRFGTSTFKPSVTLAKPVIYNLTLTGLDLSEVNPETVRFVYMGNDGNYYDVKYESLAVDIESGKLQVVNAELEHFSRYGFTN